MVCGSGSGRMGVVGVRLVGKEGGKLCRSEGGCKVGERKEGMLWWREKKGRGE